ncbi:DsrE family protein [Thiomicrospira microaerophila]|uniref:DsrE family protein n=1 Tax=Thiomicrospira microaerophila TaxID=406020 RepID=UPI00200D4863|nr:DsrE family protein [Thiomicrospira microaerophila]UQB42406.1 DsrE family protein [Thiomicrospira microaerophila]
MKKLIALFGLWALALSAQAQYQEPKITHEGYGNQKVVYQLNDSNPDFQLQILRNVNNHVRAIGADKIDLKIVVFAGGMAALETSKPETVAALENLRAQGVEIKVCNNTLRARNVDWRSLKDVEETDIVPAGVAEIAHLQAKGYQYLRP